MRWDRTPIAHLMKLVLIYIYIYFWYLPPLLRASCEYTARLRAGFCEPFISVTMTVINLKQEPKDAHFSLLRINKPSKQLTKCNEYEIYLSRENF